MKHRQFHIQQLYALPTLYLCVLYLSEKNSDMWHLQHKLIGFYNRDEKCLQRGKGWVFKYSGLPFVFKGSRFEAYRIHRVTQKNGNFWKTQQKLKKSKEKNLLTEIEPLQFSF